MRELLHRPPENQAERHTQMANNSNDNDVWGADKTMRMSEPDTFALKMHTGTEKIQMMTDTPAGVKSDEDRSVLQIKTFPWKGTICSNGNSSIGFHKGPEQGDGKSDNIWPAFSDGDIVKVIGIAPNNWLHVSRVRDKKTETGYVDWRFVKTDAQIKTAKDELIKKKYFEIVDKGASHYIEAIQYLIDTYNLDASHAIMSYNSTITGAYAITGGDVGDKKVPVEFAPPCFSKSEDFGTICRAVAHELIHTKQKALGMADHDEREFLAYHNTLTRTDMPEIQDMPTLKLFVTKAIQYYNNLPNSKKIAYVFKIQDVNKIKTKHGF